MSCTCELGIPTLAWAELARWWQGVIAMQKALQGFTSPWTQAITMSTEYWLDR